MGIIAEHWAIDERVHLEVQRATGLRRATGLIGRRPPAPGHALLIERCASVHGVGIRAPLDVVFCAQDGEVLAVKRLQIGGIRGCNGAAFVLELAAGEAERLAIAVGARAKKRSAKGGSRSAAQTLNQVWTLSFPLNPTPPPRSSASPRTS